MSARFSDLRELLGESLLEYVSKSRDHRHDILMLLKMLGTDEASAKPWIVVQCDKVIAKKVTQFFKQPNIKGQYQSTDFPIFQVHVEARPLKRLGTAGSIDVFIRRDFSKSVPTTLSGSCIKATNGVRGGIATLGGIITVEFATGSKQLFGLTVAHILDDEMNRDTSAQNAEASSLLAEMEYELEEYDEDELEEEEEEKEEEEERGAEEDEEEEEEIFELDYMEDEADHHIWDGRIGEAEVWQNVGYISSYSTATPGNQNLDWALVEIKDKRFIQPNSCLEFDEDSELLERPSPTLNGRPVTILSGNIGQKEGILYAQRAHLMLGQGNSFTETYSVSLNSGSSTWSYRPKYCVPS